MLSPYFASSAIASSLSAVGLCLVWMVPSFAQSITADGTTATQINRVGQRYDITGTTLSGDGSNLFHSLETFGLTSSEIANFISTPDLQNILTRVTGGDASIINGLIQVTGGDPNLYLMNPAGLIFGDNASLNVPADFTATTASGIGFGDQWFSAVGENDYGALMGSPSSLAFSVAQPGAIVNSGTLGVDAGQQLTLVGGTVINTGTLDAVGGQVTIAAVPGENIVRLSQDHQLLNLEFETIDPLALDSALPNDLGFTPTDVATLLTGGAVDTATGVTVNADGTIALTGSDVAIAPIPGTAIASGTLNVSNTLETPLLPDSITPPLAIGGQVQVLGDRVALLNTTIDASGTNGGGTVWVGGNPNADVTVPSARRTLVDEGSAIAADGLADGSGGEVILWSTEATGFYGRISARGGSISGDGGFVEASGQQTLVFDGLVDVSAINGAIGEIVLDPTNIIIASGDGGDAAADAALVTSGQILADDFSGQEITISETTLEGLTGDVRLEATNDITINDLDDNELSFVTGTGTITFQSDADGDTVGSFAMIDPNDAIRTNGRAIDIAGASLSLGTINTVEDTTGQVGQITLMATNGGINVADLTSRSFSAAEPITLVATTPVSVGDVSGGDIVFGGDIALNQPLTIFGNNVIFEGAIDGNQALSVVATPVTPSDALPSGQISFTEKVGANISPGSIEVNASDISLLPGSSIGGDSIEINVSNDITFSANNSITGDLIEISVSNIRIRN